MTRLHVPHLHTLHRAAMPRREPLAARMTDFLASRRFIVGQATALMLWFVFNSLAATGHWHFDAYPFILANLGMSAEAAFATSIILMADAYRRQEDEHRTDLMVRILTHLEDEGHELREINDRQLALIEELHALRKERHG